MNRKKYTLWWLLGALLAIGLTVLYFWLSPRVLAIAPTVGAYAQSPESQIRVTFSRAMDQAGVEAGLVISPDIQGTYSWEGNTLTFTPIESWAPDTIVNISIPVGLKSNLGLSLREGLQSTFAVSAVRLAYLWPTGVGANLYLMDLSSGETSQLTHSKGLLDFDVDENRHLIYFSALNGLGGSDLFVINAYSGVLKRILACQQVFCENVQVSENGQNLAFERYAAYGVPEVWWMLLGGNPQRLSPEGEDADTPQWSPDGRLVYYNRSIEAYQFVDAEGQLMHRLSNKTGEPGSWSFTGQKFIFHEHYDFSSSLDTPPISQTPIVESITNPSETLELYKSHLLSFNTFTKILNDLSGTAGAIEDTEPAISPDGRVIAFARTELDAQEVEIGRTIWLMRSDGSEQRYLTGDPDYRHTAFAWHPDGDKLAYVRFNTIELTEPPEIWLVTVSNANAIRLLIGGFDPLWIP